MQRHSVARTFHIMQYCSMYLLTPTHKMLIINSSLLKSVLLVKFT